jgi:hypothetical protein
MNAPLLRKVAKRIKENPENYDQMTYCGTTCCIAGHVGIILNKKFPVGIPYDLQDVWVEEIRLEMGLSHKQWDSLCVSADEWPEEFADRWIKGIDRKSKAQVAHDRIMHLIKTGE